MKAYSRREMLKLTGGAALVSAIAAPNVCRAAAERSFSSKGGAIIGETAGEDTGARILAEGGNAIDAAIAAALVSCVAVPSRCGVGGYGGHMTIATDGGRRVSSIDFNSAAPQAARPDMYKLAENGKVVGDVNFHGWLAVGVPGTMAGLQLAIDRFGTRPFRELVQPAIALARKGVVVQAPLANTIRLAAPRLRKDPGSAAIYLRDGQPLREGEVVTNPKLAELLSTLAERNSVDTFYRGDIARQLADDFKRNGGLVTAADLGAYHAREVHPYRLEWEDHTIYTAPLTAGGLTIIEAITILKALDWNPRSSAPENVHPWLEALRLAWKDRLELLGDPEKVHVPIEKLLSKGYAHEQAKRIQAAVRKRGALPIQIEKHLDEGTVDLSCIDSRGNMIAITLTQGGGFGAQVTSGTLGITLGHGMSRFFPRADHPNCPGPGKRPLHNMCPTVVLRRGKPSLAVGAAGGLKIPNSIYTVLTEFIGRRKNIEEAVAAPRLHTTGTLEVGIEPGYSAPSADYLRKIGFDVKPGPNAMVSAVSYDARTGATRAAYR
jgi:gamma-glutamyltranspeptidase / glutathione hydrolase